MRPPTQVGFNLKQGIKSGNIKHNSAGIVRDSRTDAGAGRSGDSERNIHEENPYR